MRKHFLHKRFLLPWKWGSRKPVSYTHLQGFTVPPFYPICHSAEEIRQEINRIGEIREQLDFCTDGAVVKVDDFADREQLGATSKFPRWAVAFKYPPEEKETVLQKIEINVGRTGVLTLSLIHIYRNFSYLRFGRL